ncbi:MAG: hypothetical protein RL240_324 [Planctomycetota bacterium]|jgi:hypothetical protein
MRPGDLRCAVLGFARLTGWLAPDTALILSGPMMRPGEIGAKSFDVQMELSRVNQTPGGLRRTA